MKIFEIIEPDEVEKISSKKFNPKMSARTQSYVDQEREGYGKFSKAGPDTEDPLIFAKDMHEPLALDRDAYYNYVKAASPFMKSNPYFPRVYKITVHKDKLGQTKPSYNLEKLHPSIVNPEGDIERISHEQQVQALDAVADRMFNKPLEFNGSKGDLGKYLEKLVTSGDYSNIKDSKLQQALELMASVREKGNFRWDLRSENIAFRLTSFGPQLVFMDPLS